MENRQLCHWGIKGMRWGIRRFQKKDGTLTPAGKKRYDDSEGSKTETVEERRARLLKSTDAQELYKNRSDLTTAEINERLYRIDTERRLSEVADRSKKSVYDRVDKALKFGRKVNEVYEFTNTPVMKALKKQLGIDKVEKRLGLEEAYAMRDKLSDKTLNDVLKRANTEKAIKKILDDNKKNRDNETKEKDAAEKERTEKEKAAKKAQEFDEGQRRYEQAQRDANRKFQDDRAAREASETVKTGDSYVTRLLESGDFKASESTVEKGRTYCEVLDRDGALLKSFYD